MKRDVDEAMPVFLRERDEVGEQDEPVRQPPRAKGEDEQLLVCRIGPGMAHSRKGWQRLSDFIAGKMQKFFLTGE